MADPPRASRLAGDRIHAQRLERQGAPEIDFDKRDLSPVLKGDAGPLAKGSGESSAGARPALPPLRRDDSRSGPGDQRAACREIRRTIRETVSTEGALEGAERRGLHTLSC